MKRNEGITMIALIVTIVVLLILAGITIGAITGNNGLIGQTQEAKEQTEIGEEKEILDISVIKAMGNDKRGNITKSNLDPELDKSIGQGKYTSIDFEDGIVVTFEESKRSYLVDKNGNVEQYEIVKDETPWELAGSGTEDDPYLIESIEDLVVLSNETNKSSNSKYDNTNIKLAINLDFNSDFSYCDPTTKVSEKENRIIEQDENGTDIKTFLTTGTGFNPIGKSTTYDFNGTFDGNEKEIRNLYINRPEEDYVGLFGISYKNITIKKLGVTGQIKGNQYVAGILGRAGVVDMSYCFNKAIIEGNQLTAGVVGLMKGELSSLKYCYNRGNITGNGTYDGSYGSTGGITGLLTNQGELYNSYNTGDITAKTAGIGGIMGYCFGDVKKVVNLGDVTCLEDSGNNGGIIGTLNTYEGEFKNSKVENSYNFGNIKNNSTYLNKPEGGIIGKNYAEGEKYEIIKNYYLLGSSIGGIEREDIPGQAEPLEESQMPKVIDVIQEQVEIDGNMINVWKEDTQNINNGYPILYWE